MIMLEKSEEDKVIATARDLEELRRALEIE
jgi:hypothetical protein